MPSEVGTFIVVCLYSLCLYVIWGVSPKLPGAASEPTVPFWRNPRIWASFVAVAQIAVYVWLR